MRSTSVRRECFRQWRPSLVRRVTAQDKGVEPAAIENVQQAAIGTREVTTNIVGVSQAATETGSAASEVLGASEALSKQAEELSGEMHRFAAEMRAA
jgi:methyl-accepting chemotaxis protein